MPIGGKLLAWEKKQAGCSGGEEDTLAEIANVPETETYTDHNDLVDTVMGISIGP